MEKDFDISFFVRMLTLYLTVEGMQIVACLDTKFEVEHHPTLPVTIVDPK